MADLRSVTDCAKALGIQRTRLSAMISESGLKKVKQGRESLVDYQEVSLLVQQSAAQGKIKTPKKNTYQNATETALETHLKEEVMRLKSQVNTLADQLEGYDALKEQMKLLKAANVALEAKTKRSGVLSRIERAIGAFKE